MASAAFPCARRARLQGRPFPLLLPNPCSRHRRPDARRATRGSQRNDVMSGPRPTLRNRPCQRRARQARLVDGVAGHRGDWPLGIAPPVGHARMGRPPAWTLHARVRCRVSCPFRMDGLDDHSSVLHPHQPSHSESRNPLIGREQCRIDLRPRHATRSCVILRVI